MKPWECEDYDHSRRNGCLNCIDYSTCAIRKCNEPKTKTKKERAKETKARKQYERKICIREGDSPEVIDLLNLRYETDPKSPEYIAISRRIYYYRHFAANNQKEQDKSYNEGVEDGKVLGLRELRADMMELYSFIEANSNDFTRFDGSVNLDRIVCKSFIGLIDAYLDGTKDIFMEEMGRDLIIYNSLKDKPLLKGDK